MARAGPQGHGPASSHPIRASMTPGHDLILQPSLFEERTPRFDRSFASVTRRHLDATAWVDHACAWVEGSDTLFRDVVRTRSWAQRERRLYDKQVIEPRLT